MLMRWIRYFLIAETMFVIFSFVALSQRRPGGKPAGLAPLFLDDPTPVESFVFYMGLFNLSAAVLLFIARLSARQKGLRRR